MKYAFIFSIIGIALAILFLFSNHFAWFYIVSSLTLLFNLCWLLFSVATRTGSEVKKGWWLSLIFVMLALLFYGYYVQNTYIAIQQQPQPITLIPANEATPAFPIGCSTLATPVASDSLLLFIGDSLYISTRDSQDMATAQGNSMFNISKNPQGQISVTASVWNSDGTLIGQITNNSFIPASSTNISINTPDKSTLTVDDQYGNELLYFHFINALSISIRGVFYNPTLDNFQIGENKQLIGPIGLSEDCIRNTTIHLAQ
jgi:hypothetical protein